MFLVSSSPTPRPVLVLGEASHFQCLLCLPVSTLRGPWEAGDGWANPEALVSDKRASLISHQGADCTRQAICPCDVLVLTGWDK